MLQIITWQVTSANPEIKFFYEATIKKTRSFYYKRKVIWL